MCFIKNYIFLHTKFYSAVKKMYWICNDVPFGYLAISFIVCFLKVENNHILLKAKYFSSK